jgi:DNA-binding MarR family transcriptional regulator
VTGPESTLGAENPEDPEEVARRVWQGMNALVFGNERRKEVVEALGMSFVRTKALRRIARQPMPVSDLAAKLLTDRPYATLIVDDLVRRGLVERTTDPADRRRKILSATPEGAAAAALAEEILLGTPPAGLAEADPADLAAVDRVVAALVRENGRGPRAGKSAR